MIVAAFYGKCMQNRDALKRDLELIELWKEVWTKAGFVPAIIGIDRAIAHPLFDDMNRFAIRMPSVNHPMFDWLCWVRWCSVAIFACETRRGCLFTDYDVFPTRLNGEARAVIMDQACHGDIVNFDPQGGAGLLYGTELGFEIVLEKFLTYQPDGQELTFNKPHISDMIVLQRHCRKLWDAGPADLQVVCPDESDTEWKKAAFVHFGGAYRTMRHLSRAQEILVRMKL